MNTCDNLLEIEIVQRIKVDRCIANEIQWLNAHGIRTEGSCCGHGKSLPVAMIKPSSVKQAKEQGYNPVYCKDVGFFEIKLKSGEAHQCPAKEKDLTG